jgi:hypothetical protein
MESVVKKIWMWKKKEVCGERAIASVMEQVHLILS